MSKVISHLAISMDGFVAGPNQSLSNPIGEGGLRLHDWHRPGARSESAGESGWDSDVDRDAAAALVGGAGAFVMGRNMFGPGRGEWDESWQGWWGPEPPYHAPVFVLTHYAREPLEMEGGTTFWFVTEGPSAALERAQAAAGDRAVHIAGGASTVQQYLRAGLLDELHLHVAPLVFGRGERLFDGVEDAQFEVISAVSSLRAAHVSYRVLH
jgi:dihydrofolate reductase